MQESELSLEVSDFHPVVLINNDMFPISTINNYSIIKLLMLGQTVCYSFAIIIFVLTISNLLYLYKDIY
jgi:hypothetical protein